MTKRMIVMLIAVLVIVGGMLAFKYSVAQGTKKFLATQAAPAQTVSTIKASAQEWQAELDAVGTLRAVNGADLSAEVAGIVDSISFDSSTDVDAGQVLVHLRDDDDVAKLRALEATAKLAQITYERDEKQVKAQAISQAALDNDLAALNSAKAQVAAQQALVAKKTIRAPFGGHLGIRQVDVGEYLTAGKAIVTLQQLDPIYVDFNLPEQSLAQVTLGQKVIAKADALPNETFEGEITAVNSKVDEGTRNIQLRATFKNPDRKLMPGMFAHITVIAGAPQKQITLPQTVITYNPYGNTVFVVAPGQDGAPIAKQVFVTLGSTRGDQVAILSGVNEGDEIVTAGQLKLRNGSPLKINNELEPKNDPNPKPEDH